MVGVGRRPVLRWLLEVAAGTGLRRAPMWSEKTCSFSSAQASIWMDAGMVTVKF